MAMGCCRLGTLQRSLAAGAVRWGHLPRSTRAALAVVALVVLVFLHQLYYLARVSHITWQLQDTPFRRVPDLDNVAAFSTTARAPPALHFLWKSADLTSYRAPPSLAAWETLLRVCNRSQAAGHADRPRVPGKVRYSVRLWTDIELEALVEEQYPWLAPTYRAYPYAIQRADIGRLVVLHHVGGVYVDLDVWPLPNDTDVLNRIDRLRTFGAIVPTATDGVTFSNHLLVAEPASPWLLTALRLAVGRDRWMASAYMRVFWSTGPFLITAAMAEATQVLPDYRLGILHVGMADWVIQHRGGRSWHGLDGALLLWAAERPLRYVLPAFLLGLGVAFAALLLTCIGLERLARVIWVR